MQQTHNQNTPSAGASKSRLGSLDGLRALAVAAVVVYHVDDRLLPGGFLGVDLFFVLSGYLVTSLLLREHSKSGSIALRDFWKRRARRLWAAAWIVLAAVALLGLFKVWGADRQALLAGEIFGAVANIANYWQLAHGGYLEQFAAPSPVRHFWSLAVEEQFYFVWPMVMIGSLALVARWGRKAMWGVLIGLGMASLSIGLMVSPERAYLGTGTRAIALIVGAILAFAWSKSTLAAPEGKGLRRGIAAWAAVGAVVLVAGAFTLHPHDEILARGGFLTIALASAGIIGLALVPGRVAGWLSLGGLVWIGRRSYGIYLIHWPLIVMMGPGRPAWVVLAVVVPITIGAAALLHSVIETPLIARRWQPVRLAQGTFALTAVTVLALLLAYPTSTPTGEVAADLRAVADPVTTEDRASAGESNEGPVSPPAEVAGATKSPTSTTTTTICIPQLPPTQSQTTLSPSRGGFDPDTVAQIGDPGWPTCDSQIDVMVVGDSTGRGMANGLVALQDPNLRVWDRTILGCSLGDEDCGDWRQEWAPHVDGIDPDVVLLYTNPVVDLKGIDDAEFLSAEGAAQRESILREAAQLLSRNGAALVFVAPPVPRSPEGLFFCNGRRSNTQCDADWVDAWIASVEKVALESGSPVLNVRAYVDELPDDRAARPDGMHFAGDALKEAAHWSRSIYALSVLKQREQQIEDAKEAFSSN